MQPCSGEFEKGVSAWVSVVTGLHRSVCVVRRKFYALGAVHVPLTPAVPLGLPVPLVLLLRWTETAYGVHGG